ncbi:MAG: hypothetical protein J6D29_02915 [Solobacterium sp.]|nr:hypothetical protein [Solobacterium sp.]
MGSNRMCDFCLTETRGLFRRPIKINDAHLICQNCRKILDSYHLPLRYELFQILVTNQKDMRDMIMNDYVKQHPVSESMAKYFPLPNILLHEQEQCINFVEATITVDSSQIPTTLAPTRIFDITKAHINNLPDAKANPVTITGKLIETNAALYFLSNNFINCHRLTSLIHERVETNPTEIQVLEKNQVYTYQVPNAELFFLRESFYQKLAAYRSNKKDNLIYIQSENTLTLTPGVYQVPRNIQPGVYWVNPVRDDGLHIRDAAGKVHHIGNGRIRLDSGSQLEVTGEYEFRFNKKEEKQEETPKLEETMVFEKIQDEKKPQVEETVVLATVSGVDEVKPTPEVDEQPTISLSSIRELDSLTHPGSSGEEN